MARRGEVEPMSDQDFNFAPPPPRRERKEFEPPPWEQHLFEQLTKQQEEEPIEGDSADGTESTPMVEPAPVAEVLAEAEEPKAAEPPSESVEGVKAEKPPLDEVRVAAMMFELRAEEVPATRMFTTATLVAGAILLLIGIVMVIWSFVMIAVALRRPEQGRSGVYVGMTVLVFGAGFAGTGAWFVFKTLRQQGVL